MRFKLNQLTVSNSQILVSFDTLGFNVVFLFRYACTVISNITVYIITWTAFGLSSSATSTISAENVDQFRVTIL